MTVTSGLGTNTCSASITMSTAQFMLYGGHTVVQGGNTVVQ
jgi:hypothetical protein